MTNTETKLYKLMEKATEPSMVLLPRYARVIEETEKALFISGKDRNGIVYIVLFVKNGKIDFFETRDEEEAQCKLLKVA